MNNVSSLLARKNRPVVSISPNTSVVDALTVMAEKNIGCIVVLEGNKYLGIFTERDYSRKVVLKGKNSSTTAVAEIMTTDLASAKPGDSIEYCMETMTSKNIRYMPVFENDQLTGIVSMSDVVKETILTQKETIDQLQNYIQS
ncbi:MAG: CBS domain-containing protein [Chitinophagaceae bacterium]|nr:CBS domain-containing protein [Chitinophagaceae bacterium]